MQAGTRLMVLRFVHGILMDLLHLERRFDPFVRPALDAVFRDRIAAVLQALINLGRADPGLRLAEEQSLPDEEAFLDSIIIDMATYMRTHYQPGGYQRAGNTKTHGIVRGEVTIRDDLPPRMRQGIFAEPRTYRAWVRFSGPGPDSPPDIDDVGFVSCAIKMMGVPGPKLLPDEKFTQDLLTICTPTFVTPDVKANAQLQDVLLQGVPFFYFFNLRRHHVLDALMQGLWNKTQTSPLEVQYWSCVPYLIGPGQAMQYSVWPRSRTRSRIPRLPLRPPDDYLRQAMAATLAKEEVEFDIYLQMQTDAYRMPIENAAVLWPNRLSPYVPAAVLRLPRQTFDSPSQLAFASCLSYTPWHCLPEHRPLGNQNRARRRLYLELSRLRQTMNATPHYEPTGDEVFQ
jgi:hypothetical protein